MSTKLSEKYETESPSLAKIEARDSSTTGTDDDAHAGRESASVLSRDSFVSSVYLLVALTIVQKALGFVRAIVICRYLSPQQLGLWSMTLTFLETLTPFLILSIPACYGRYFEKYESVGQLKGFIRQSIILIGLCFVTGLTMLFLLRQPLTVILYGDAQYLSMFLTGLAVVIPFGVFGVLASLLTGLRKSRTRSLSEFLNGTAFTVFAIAIFVWGNASAFSIAYAFAGAYTLASLFSMVRVTRMYRQLDQDHKPLIWRSTWAKLAPAIFVFWLSDFLSNLFFTVDRFMIISLSPIDSGEPLVQVGNYEAAHVMPFLFSSFMAIVAKVLLPYLSNDWEKGNTSQVATKVNLSIKLGGITLILGSTFFLWVSSDLFETLFDGKFEDGLSVLPYVAFFYVGSAMTFLLLNYFWCSERGKFAVAGLVCGLVANVAVNAILIQSLGIKGAAIGTVVAIITQFVFLWIAAIRIGMNPDWKVLAVFLYGLFVCFSPYVSIVAASVLGLLAVSGLLFSKQEMNILFRRQVL